MLGIISTKTGNEKTESLNITGARGEAKKHLKHCLSLFLEVGDKLGIAETMTALAELDFADGKMRCKYGKLT